MNIECRLATGYPRLVVRVRWLTLDRAIIQPPLFLKVDENPEGRKGAIIWRAYKSPPVSRSQYRLSITTGAVVGGRNDSGPPLFPDVLLQYSTNGSNLKYIFFGIIPIYLFLFRDGVGLYFAAGNGIA